MGSKTANERPKLDLMTMADVCLELHVSRKTVYLRECVSLLASQIAADIISAVIHRDQGAPHVHCLLLPIVGGKWVGSRLLDKRATMKLRATLFAGPAARYGLRQPPRLTGTRKAEAVRLVLSRMEQSPARECPFWPEFRACIEANPASFLARMGLELPVTKPARSFTAIMTSTGKRTDEDARRGRDACRPATKASESSTESRQPAATELTTAAPLAPLVAPPLPSSRQPASEPPTAIAA